MFGSTILDLAIGLIFTFLVVSLITSAVTESFASALSWRADTLLQGIKDLVNDPQFTGLALSLYNHALVNPQSNGTTAAQTEPAVKPAYIDPKQFASALIDVAGLLPGTDVPALQAKINADIADPQLKTMLNGIVVRAGGNIDRIRDDLAAWFNNGMDRVAGVYKRKTQRWSFLIAVVLVVALNVDTVKIAMTLWDQPMVIKDLPQISADKPQDAIDALQAVGLPFGWDDHAIQNLGKTRLSWLFAIVGWLITAVATLFGAPFWFDSLQKFVQLRGAGSK